MRDGKKCADTPANFVLPANLGNYTEICNFLAGQRWVDGGLQISIVKVKQRKASQANIMLRFLRRWALYKYSIDAQYLSYICTNTTYFSKYNLEHGGNMK